MFSLLTLLLPQIQDDFQSKGSIGNKEFNLGILGSSCTPPATVQEQGFTYRCTKKGMFKDGTPKYVWSIAERPKDKNSLKLKKSPSKKK